MLIHFRKVIVKDFWKEVKLINNSRVPLAASIEGAENIFKLWREYYMGMFLIVFRGRNFK